MRQTKSGLAEQAIKQRNVKDRSEEVPHGVCVHTTGRRLAVRAMRNNVSPLRMAEKFYTTPGSAFAHYVIDTAGHLLQIADEKERAWHTGIPGKERELYLSGRWRERVAPKALERWEAKWLNYQSPLELFPGRSPNDAYLGVELIPLLSNDPQGGWFTEIQYEILSQLVTDIGVRYGINMFENTRLVGHEDLEPLTRWDDAGGWDPGALRHRPRFHWTQVQPVATVPLPPQAPPSGRVA